MQMTITDLIWKLSHIFREHGDVAVLTVDGIVTDTRVIMSQCNGNVVLLVPKPQLFESEEQTVQIN